MSTEAKRMRLDRRVCVVREGRIDVRPERGAILGPLLGLSVSVALFVAVALFASDLPAGALAAMLLPGLVLGPFSAMAFVHSVLGAYVIIDAMKQSATFQQGVLGLGLGTVELVPFWKIDRLEVQDLPLGEVTPKGPPPLLDLRAWDIVLVKTSGKQLSLGQVVAATGPALLAEGFDRALDAAEAMSALVGQPVLITAAVEERVGAQADQPIEGRVLSEVESPDPRSS